MQGTQSCTRRLLIVVKMRIWVGFAQGIDFAELRDTIVDLFHECDLLLNLLNARGIIDIANSSAYRQHNFENSYQAIKPGADCQPPVLCFSQAVSISNR